MSGTLTPFGRQQLLLATFQHDVYVPPTSLYLAVTLGMPVANASADDLSEPDEILGYAREAYPAFGAAAWTPTGFGEIFNAQTRTMPDLTGTAGLVQGYAILDATDVGTGNVWAVGNVIEPFIYDNDTAPFFDVGDVLIGLYD